MHTHAWHKCPSENVPCPVERACFVPRQQEVLLEALWKYLMICPTCEQLQAMSHFEEVDLIHKARQDGHVAASRETRKEQVNRNYTLLGSIRDYYRDRCHHSLLLQ